MMPVCRKSRRLARALGDAMAWAYVVALWTYSVRENLGDDLSELEPAEIAEAAGWRGDAEAFVEALVETRWLDRPALGRLVLHEFDLYNGRFVEQQGVDREAARERMRRLRAAAREKASGTPEEAEGTLSAGGTPPKAGTPAREESRSGERSGERSRARASCRDVSFRAVGEGPGEGPAADEATDLADFERFWTAYPRRSKKVPTLAAWRATRAVRPPTDELLERLAVLVDSVEWNRDAGRYRPTSLAFIEEHRWEDSSTPRRSPAAAAAAPELDDFDLHGRLARLAAAVRGVVARGPELALEILAAAKEGPADLVEQRLDAIDRELLAAAELELSREERAEVDRIAIEAARRAPGAATAHQVDDVAARLRPQVLRRERRLPRLTLFGAEAEGRERGAA